MARRRDVITAEASGPARLVGQADCATGGAVFRLHWRSARLLVRRHAAQRQWIFKNCYSLRAG